MIREPGVHTSFLIAVRGEAVTRALDRQKKTLSGLNPANVFSV